MRLIDALHHIKKQGEAVISTKDAAVYLGITNAHASQLLIRLASSNQITHLGRGVWCLQEHIHPFLLPQHLVAPFPTYISLQSALYHHDMISQISSVVYAVSIARTRFFQTNAISISIHHISPDFFFGFELDSKSGIKMATPEKALLDMIYLSLGKHSLFQALPELELPKSFSLSKTHRMIEKIPSKRIRTLVSNRFKALWETSVNHQSES